MLTVTLIPNRSTPSRFVAATTYERKGNIITPVRRTFTVTNGRRTCTSCKVVPWPRKDWGPVYSGEVGSHGRPFTIKRDWIMLHTALEMARLASAMEGAGY